jgi:hypothetical protein
MVVLTQTKRRAGKPSKTYAAGLEYSGLTGMVKCDWCQQSKDPSKHRFFTFGPHPSEFRLGGTVFVAQDFCSFRCLKEFAELNLEKQEERE